MREAKAANTDLDAAPRGSGITMPWPSARSRWPAIPPQAAISGLPDIQRAFATNPS